MRRGTGKSRSEDRAEEVSRTEWNASEYRMRGPGVVYGDFGTDKQPPKRVGTRGRRREYHGSSGKGGTSSNVTSVRHAEHASHVASLYAYHRYAAPSLVEPDLA